MLRSEQSQSGRYYFMALRNIVLQGDECLSKVCRPVTEFNPRLHQLLDDMRETLIEANGAGLAAPGVPCLSRPEAFRFNSLCH